MELSQLIRDYLYNPNSGYYKTKNPIGKDNDFITAPEISQIFGEIAAGYILNFFSNFRCEIDFIEIGAGKGTWLYDILHTISNLSKREIAVAKDFLKMANLHIIETNNHLIEIQRAKLIDYRISWHEDFKSFVKKNTNRALFVISNELFDCLPIDQYIKTANGWQKIMVQKVNNKLYFKPDNNKNDRQAIEDNYNDYPVESIIEISNDTQNLFREIADYVRSKTGLILTIDYGYIEPTGRSTLQAVKNHQKIPLSNIFLYPERCDLTSHVDFGQLDKIAKSNNLYSTLCTQREFLLTGGIEQRKNALITNNPNQKEEIEGSVNRLISNDEMGKLFKVHIATKNSSR